MFSIAGDDNKTVASTGATPAELPGLDDLQLGMDYEQIMHYFENLKVDLMDLEVQVNLIELNLQESNA